MLNPAVISAQIKAALDSVSDTQIDPAVARQQMADQLAATIVQAVMSAQINYVSGLATPSGPVVGVFVGTLT